MTETLTFHLARVATPVGAMMVAADDEDRLRLLEWEDNPGRIERLAARFYGPDVLLKTIGSTAMAERLQAYVGGDIAAIDDISVATDVGTAFQRAVWAALRRIPAGQTWSYGRLAAHIGRPTAMRAVGLANGANPIGVVVPCHRVIGANGTLTGYGGGIERKRWLLRHEGARFRDEGARLLEQETD
jgi:methylated-DNA-[protein]-cysteine S-methyltransferase